MEILTIRNVDSYFRPSQAVRRRDGHQFASVVPSDNGASFLLIPQLLQCILDRLLRVIFTGPVHPHEEVSLLCRVSGAQYRRRIRKPLSQRLSGLLQTLSPLI